MIHVIPEVVEVGGRRKVKGTIRDDERGVDADLLDPFNAAQRRKAAQRLADRAGEPLAAERIEQAVLQCIDLLQQSDEQVEAAREAQAAEADGAASDADAAPMTVVRPEMI